MSSDNRYLMINALENRDTILALSSNIRLDILQLLTTKKLNIGEIAKELDLPQSTAATNVAILEKAGLVGIEIVNGRKGNQKKCAAAYEEILIQFLAERQQNENSIEVEMPIGLYTNYTVTAPCGLCSPEGIIGYLDVPDSFLNPDRMRAGLLWFETGWVEYKYPNNSLYSEKILTALEISAEISSETPGTNSNWLSDISMWVNDVELGVWTSPGDFGDKRGKLTPGWWKLEGSQYGLLKKWTVSDTGTCVDGVRVSDTKLGDLRLKDHHSIRVRIGVKEDARHPGGINIFGRGFGNYDQAIFLRLHF